MTMSNRLDALQPHEAQSQGEGIQEGINEGRNESILKEVMQSEQPLRDEGQEEHMEIETPIREQVGNEAEREDELDNSKEEGVNHIRRLPQSVVNKIAAGEIIIQPANALKEILENSIDAGSTSIEVIVKDGGLKLLQINDNGCGIRNEDLPLLCERYATSKLSKFEDLDSIATYGFRGEALASISHISRLSVITKTRDSSLAYKAFYCDGVLTAPNFKLNSPGDPKPIAGKDGTQIIIEDLFYNTPSRLKSMGKKIEELGRILDVIGRYAIHTEKSGLSCKKFGEAFQIVSTRPNLPLKERIRIVYGSEIANELLFLPHDEEYSYGLVKLAGAITSPNYSNKKKISPVIFINHRLVSCDPLRRAINAVYLFFLQKGFGGFAYILLEIKPENLDVNVHPTKREVRFLHEEEIIEAVSTKVHALLTLADALRKYKSQSIVTKRPLDEDPASKKRQENKMVRVDSQQSKINSFLLRQSEDAHRRQNLTSQKRVLVDEESELARVGELSEDETSKSGKTCGSDLPTPLEEVTPNYISSDFTLNDNPRVSVNLDSIKQLRVDLTDSVHKPLTNIFNNAVYVGVVDSGRRLCCFQYDVKLYLCDYAAVLAEFYYQTALIEFCNYGTYKFLEPQLLRSLLSPLYTKANLVPIQDVIDNLWGLKDMFLEYFQITFEQLDEEIYIATLPMIIKEIQPVPSKIAFFIYRLSSKVNFLDEKECLLGIMRQIALLYLPEVLEEDDGRERELEEEHEIYKTKRDQVDHTLGHILFPQLMHRFLATKNLTNDVVQIADLPGLYKVFERC